MMYMVYYFECDAQGCTSRTAQEIQGVSFHYIWRTPYPSPPEDWTPYLDRIYCPRHRVQATIRTDGELNQLI
jgi:hypothetical protein